MMFSDSSLSLIFPKIRALNGYLGLMSDIHLSFLVSGWKHGWKEPQELAGNAQCKGKAFAVGPCGGALQAHGALS